MAAKTRSERKAANRKEWEAHERQFAVINIEIRNSAYFRLTKGTTIPGEDKEIAQRLGMERGPIRGYIDALYAKANLQKVRVFAVGCRADSEQAFLSLALANLPRWKKQARAVERSLHSGKIRVGSHGQLFSCWKDKAKEIKPQSPYGLMHIITAVLGNGNLPDLALRKYTQIRVVVPMNRMTEETLNSLLKREGDKIGKIDQLFKGQSLVDRIVDIKTRLRDLEIDQTARVEISIPSLIPD